MEKVLLIPTGNEICQGIVLDTNSPALMEIILEKFPQACVQRLSPVQDDLDAIRKVIEDHRDWNLIILIGGSGGGKQYDPDLAADMTHPALEHLLQQKIEKRIYGYNGHLWSRLLIGKLAGGSLVANVPGPYAEAVAAGKALIGSLAEGRKLSDVLEQVAAAVLAQYPSGGTVK
jgi:molybdopterin biosynthesis enzyme MoaB